MANQDVAVSRARDCLAGRVGAYFHLTDVAERRLADAWVRRLPGEQLLTLWGMVGNPADDPGPGMVGDYLEDVEGCRAWYRFLSLLGGD